MAIKVFVLPITNCQYAGEPANRFEITVDYRIAQTTGLIVNAGNRTFNIPLDTAPSAVYQLVYDDVLAFCVDNELETPTKADIFGYVPMDFSTLLPE